MRIGAYLLKQKLSGRKRYPLVLMLEPLFRCNLACVGCGKIDYPDPILNRRLSVKECLDAVDECGAPMVAIPGGEPLIHKEIGEIVEGHRRAQEIRLALHQRAAAGEEAASVRAVALSVLLGPSRRAARASRQVGLPGRRVRPRRVRDQGRQGQGLHRQRQCHDLRRSSAPDIAAFLDYAKELGVGVSISPGYAYERAPDQEHFLSRRKTKELFRDVFALGKGKNWKFIHSALFLDFLAGNQTYHCTPWGMPTRNIFGWQKPCYLLGEGYAKTFKELMETTDWDSYGTGRYEKCANCMAHCGYEPTAAEATLAQPWQALKVALRGLAPRERWRRKSRSTTSGRREYVFSRQVEEELAAMHQAEKQAGHSAGGGGVASARCSDVATANASQARPTNARYIPNATAGAFALLRLR